MGSDPQINYIRIPILLWKQVILDLRRRGGGKRESGAFLLGLQHGSYARVTTYICYDDLDPHAYQAGGIAFHAGGCAELWRYCKEKKLEILGDVHTHPGQGVGQSLIDQQNPMIPLVGHTALIVPNFAQTRWWSLKNIGVYEYLGNFKWLIHKASERQRRIKLTPW